MNKNHSQIHEMLHNIGKNWSKLPNYLKNGNLFLRDGFVYCEKFDYEFINKKLNEQMAETS